MSKAAQARPTTARQQPELRRPATPPDGRNTLGPTGRIADGKQASWMSSVQIITMNMRFENNL